MSRLTPPWLGDPSLKRLLAALGAPALDVRFVGGCVRDALLQRPAADFDIGTPEPPEAVLKRLDSAGIRAIPTGIQHGTVTALVDGRHYEITSLRRDVATDGRHATVAFTTDWKVDAARRDFTMNALSLSPDGELFDYFKGASDARVGRLRFVGDPAERIKEDHLRILRLFRFQAWYGRKALSPILLDVCKSHRELLRTVSAERIQREIVKLLSSPNPVLAVSHMISCGIFAEVFPDCDGGQNLLKLVMAEQAYRVRPRWIIRLAAMLPIGRALSIAERLRLANADAEELRKLMTPDPEIWAAMPKPALDAALYHGGPALIEARTVLAIARGRQLAGWAPIFAAVRAWTPKPLPIDGAALMARGIAEGPAVGAALAKAENLWIASGFAARTLRVWPLTLVSAWA